MSTMYDSTNPAAIPDTAEAIAIYIDGIYRQVWVNALAAGRFPNTPKRYIAAVTVNTPSDTADFERYDLAPSDGPIWHRNMTALGISNLWAYANRSNRVAVEDAMWAAGVPLNALSMWIATLDGTQSVAPYRYPVAAVQYTDTGSVDLSVVYQTFGAATGQLIGDTLTPEEHQLLVAIYNTLFGGHSPADIAAGNSRITDLEAQVAALKAASPAAEPKTISLTITGTGSGTLS